MNREAALAELIRCADRLHECINFDEHGRFVGTQLVGGNGGLISGDTSKAADAYARARDVWGRFYGSSDTNPASADPQGREAMG